MAASKPTQRRGSGRAARRRELVKATRELFDRRGMQEAPIEEIARSVGIARGLIYREFSSKDELYVLTVTDYLDELDGLLKTAVETVADPPAQLEQVAEAFAGFCGRYPAFVDSSLALMRRPAQELNELVSEVVWLSLGQGMARCLGHVADVLRSGDERGDFAVADPDYMANFLWTQMLGAMNLVRIQVGVKQVGPDSPGLFRVSQEEVVRSCVASAMALVRPA